MNVHIQVKVWQKFFVIGVAVLMGLVGALVLVTASTEAQSGGEIFVDKQLGRSSPVVHVGEYLTFTILIENRASFTITTLPLSDTFNVDVLAYVDAVPAPDSVDGTTGRIDWNDLTTVFGDLGPGEQVMVVVGFIAEHPAPTVVNRAAVHDAIGSQGELADGNDVSEDGESVGGSSPVTKKLLNGGIPPQVGLPLTFTAVITNDGFTTMTVVPLVDDYDPAFLQFSYAIPQPDIVDEVSGELIWSDLTTWAGDVPAHGSIEVTIVFIALAPVDLTLNQAAVADGQDWYGNDLSAGGDQVPIVIVGDTAQATATATATATSAAATATATSVVAATATSGGQATTVATATEAVATATRELASQMPDTGIAPPSSTGLTLFLAVLAAGLPIVVWFAWQRRRAS